MREECEINFNGERGMEEEGKRKERRHLNKERNPTE
jgi:hypothetical protein